MAGAKLQPELQAWVALGLGKSLGAWNSSCTGYRGDLLSQTLQIGVGEGGDDIEGGRCMYAIIPFRKPKGSSNPDFGLQPLFE